nr:MAG TPA: hypothetical protein [Caudoviricetes sp.]
MTKILQIPLRFFVNYLYVYYVKKSIILPDFLETISKKRPYNSMLSSGFIYVWTKSSDFIELDAFSSMS